jgi:hypothetical protein
MLATTGTLIAALAVIAVALEATGAGTARLGTSRSRIKRSIVETITTLSSALAKT